MIPAPTEADLSLDLGLLYRTFYPGNQDANWNVICALVRRLALREEQLEYEGYVLNSEPVHDPFPHEHGEPVG